MDEEMESKAVDVVRKRDGVMLILEENVLNAASAYAPRVGCEEKDKQVFRRDMDEVRCKEYTK